ncbi:hypothetical protein BA766_06565 [Stenotrophomonas maltophilia]|nr:hypothetical protein BA766_06565 [Stenotrophomonas maltophilia]
MCCAERITHRLAHQLLDDASGRVLSRDDDEVLLVGSLTNDLLGRRHFSLRRRQLRKKALSELFRIAIFHWHSLARRGS